MTDYAAMDEPQTANVYFRCATCRGVFRSDAVDGDVDWPASAEEAAQNAERVIDDGTLVCVPCYDSEDDESGGGDDDANSINPLHVGVPSLGVLSSAIERAIAKSYCYSIEEMGALEWLSDVISGMSGDTLTAFHIPPE